jgi:4-amino-4-deoxy-L-arabinose transferase-like glycosyltransferase
MTNDERRNTIHLVLAIVSATSGQILLSRHDLRGLGLYALAISLLVIWLRREEQAGRSASSQVDTGRSIPSESVPPDRRRFGRLWRLLLLPMALANALLAYLAAADNTYRWYGVVAWLLAVGLFLLFFWQRDPDTPPWSKLGLSRDGWRLSWTALVVAALILIGIWFRFWRLAELPPEMNLDHVSNLLDVHKLAIGRRPIFFERNTGREPWLFYWTLSFIRLFGLEIRFFALKLSIAAASLLTLPGVYLLGRELFGRWVGLWATLFTAVASWPVLLSRIGLRSILNPTVTAWSLLFLIRGLRHSRERPCMGRRNDFLLLGVSLGIGLHGYTAFRAMPLAVVVCWLLGWLAARLSHRPHPHFWRNAMLTVLVALVVSIPLGRYALDHPDDFWHRSFSRMSDPTHPYQESIPVVFVKNLCNLAVMFHYWGDVVWVAHWQREAPVLDPILGALLILGLVMILWHGLRQRDMLSLLLLVAGGLLLLPSALSFAFPSENPSVMRTSGAIPVVMTVAALPAGLGLKTAWDRLRGWWRVWIASVALILVFGVVLVNWQRIFVDYSRQYNYYTINTTEIAAAIQDFADSGGDLSNAYVVKGRPYWIDTRGVGIELGQIGWDNDLLEIEDADAHLYRPRPRLYVLKSHNTAELAYLQKLFPDGQATVYPSRYPGEDLTTFYVPPYP